LELLLPQTWDHISRDALRAATLLQEHPRSSISRAYYAAFSAGVWLIWSQQGKPQSGCRETPSHRTMPQIIEKLLYAKGSTISRDCRKAMLVLYTYRLAADYQSRHGNYSEKDARHARILASSLMKNCGVI
jgi:uncharacterized protein (UPF0332 family)